MAVAQRARPMQNPEPVDRIQRFLPGPPSPIRPEPTTLGCSPTAPCTRAPAPRVAKNGARMPTESYMEARCESRGVVGAARMVWEDRACTAAPRQPSLSQTNRCLLRALRTAGRGLLCPVPSGTPCPAPAACLGASRPLPCQDAGGGGHVLKDERAEADHMGGHRCRLSCVECGPAARSCGPTHACQGVDRRK